MRETNAGHARLRAATVGLARHRARPNAMTGKPRLRAAPGRVWTKSRNHVANVLYCHPTAAW